MNLRKATRADLPVIIAMLADDYLGGAREDTRPEALALYEAAFTRIEATNGIANLYVAEHEGAIAGSFLLTYNVGLSHQGMVRAVLEEVRIAAPSRGKGLGSEMVRLAIEEARKAGAGVFQLTSNKTRTDAHRFYEALGFDKSHEGFKLKL